ncbi:MAG: hypothetical protein LBG65_06995, partial [Puniceicoccales bacterium]|nr:hypothetical protein [Puniceicoccales bacterium]
MISQYIRGEKVTFIDEAKLEKTFFEVDRNIINFIAAASCFHPRWRMRCLIVRQSGFFIFHGSFLHLCFMGSRGCRPDMDEIKSLSLNNGCSLETNQPACQADETPVGKTLFLIADKELAA